MEVILEFSIFGYLFQIPPPLATSFRGPCLFLSLNGSFSEIVLFLLFSRHAPLSMPLDSSLLRFRILLFFPPLLFDAVHSLSIFGRAFFLGVPLLPLSRIHFSPSSEFSPLVLPSFPSEGLTEVSSFFFCFFLIFLPFTVLSLHDSLLPFFPSSFGAASLFMSFTILLRSSLPRMPASSHLMQCSPLPFQAHLDRSKCPHISFLSFF